MERVRVYSPKGVPSRTGIGLFARTFMERFPLLPAEDEGRLHDPALRENFVERLFTVHRWRRLLAAGRTRGGLVQFQSENKLLVLSHSPRHASALGKLVAQAKSVALPDLFERYFALLAEALRLKATVAKHCNVLHHILGYFKKQLTADEKQEALEVVEEYRHGSVPLIVPITLLNHYVRKYSEPYLRQQTYLHPHPAELALRNHV